MSETLNQFRNTRRLTELFIKRILDEGMRPNVHFEVLLHNYVNELRELLKIFASSYMETQRIENQNDYLDHFRRIIYLWQRLLDNTVRYETDSREIDVRLIEPDNLAQTQRLTRRIKHLFDRISIDVGDSLFIESDNDDE